MKLRRDLEGLLSDSLYHAKQGTTDSELLFLLLMQYGLEFSPGSACAAVITLLEEWRDREAVRDPLRLSFMMSDGLRLYGVRYASDRFSPSLYSSRQLDNGGISISSEPLDGNAENWEMLEVATMVEMGADATEIHPLLV